MRDDNKEIDIRMATDSAQRQFEQMLLEMPMDEVSKFVKAVRTVTEVPRDAQVELNGWLAKVMAECTMLMVSRVYLRMKDGSIAEEE
jgi:hypothetical protein